MTRHVLQYWWLTEHRWLTEWWCTWKVFVLDTMLRLVCRLRNTVLRLWNLLRHPKLELLACVLLSKLILSVKEAVVVRGRVAQRILLVRFANFVVVDQTYSKRLDELDRISGSGYSENVAQECLMDVPTDINPSDITTRLLSPNAFFSELCWKGLDFLQFEILVCHVRVFWSRWKFLKNRRWKQCFLPLVKKSLGLEKW